MEGDRAHEPGHLLPPHRRVSKKTETWSPPPSDPGPRHRPRQVASKQILSWLALCRPRSSRLTTAVSTHSSTRGFHSTGRSPPHSNLPQHQLWASQPEEGRRSCRLLEVGTLPTTPEGREREKTLKLILDQPTSGTKNLTGPNLPVETWRLTESERDLPTGAVRDPPRLTSST